VSQRYLDANVGNVQRTRGLSNATSNDVSCFLKFSFLVDGIAVAVALLVAFGSFRFY